MAYCPLEQAVIRVCRHQGIDLVADLLVENPEQGLTPRRLNKVAKRLGLLFARRQVAADKLEELTPPYIMRLEDDQYAVVISYDAPVCWLQGDDREHREAVPLESLQPQYTGECFFLDESSGSHQDELLPGINNALRQYWPHYSQILFATVLVNLFTLAVPFFTNLLFDKVIPNNATDTLWVLTIGMALIILFDLLMRNLRSLLAEDACRGLTNQVDEALLKRLAKIRYDVLPRSASTIRAAMQDFSKVREVLSSQVLMTLFDLPFVIIFSFLIWVIGGPLVWVIIAIALLISCSAVISYWLTSKQVAGVLDTHNKKQAFLAEYIGAMETLKALNAADKLGGRWRRLVEDEGKQSMLYRHRLVKVTSILHVAMQSLIVGSLVMGLYLVNAQQITMGDLFACIILGSRAISPLSQLSTVINRIQHSRAAIRSLKDLLDRPLLEQGISLSNTQTEANIKLDQVSYRYAENEPLQLQHINLNIKEGERIAIIGPTGAGKSTLIKLLAGLIPPTQGRVLFDDINLQHIDYDDIRTLIGYAPQQPALLKGTISSNLLLGCDEVNQKQLGQACKITALDDFIARSPYGLQHPVLEGGVNLSGGTRQSLALARLFMRNHKVLIMDEPTAALDNNSEYLFIDRLKKFMSDQTLILVTHRMSLLQLVDRVIVMSAGQVVMDGEKNTVLERISPETAQDKKTHTPPSGAAYQSN